MKDRLKPLALVIACVGTLGAGRPALAQDTLRVLDHLPREVARPGDVITITFDRPVAGSLEHMVEPSRIVRVEPAVRARMEWRDPSTIRIVPLEPLQPGRRYTFTVDTAFAAFDGSRLAAPERFTLGVRGPQLIGSVPYLAVGNGTQTLDPTGRLLLGFSAPVADSVLNRTVVLTTNGGDRCRVARAFAYHLVQQRVVRDSDPWELRYHAWSADSVSRRFQRLAELKPDEPLPEDCAAVLSVPSFDSLDAVTVRYPVRTARPFGLDTLTCQEDCAFAKSMTLKFSAPVAPHALLAAVKFEPAAAFSPEAPENATTQWTVVAAPTPRSTYRVTVDTSVRDIYGRRLAFGFVRSQTIGDRNANVGYHAGLVMVPTRPVPTIRVRHVNADSVALRLMPVPELDRARQLRYGPWWASDRRRPLPDTIVKVVALHAPFNEERVSEVPLPELTGRLAGRLVAMRMLVTKRTRPPGGQPAPRNARTPVVVIATEDIAPPIAFLQATDLLVHVRVSAGIVMAWVTSVRDNLPVSSAEVTVLDTAGAVVARGTTDDRGVATIAVPRPSAPPRYDTDYEYGVWSPVVPFGTAYLIDVRKGNDRSLLDLTGRSVAMLDADELDATFDGGALSSGRETHVTAFTDRGVYRPGERAYLGAVIRDGSLGSLRVPPPGDSARLRMSRTTRDGTKETLHDAVLRISPLGTLTDSVALRPNAALGYYEVTCEVVRQGGWQRVGSTTFFVAEYRAPEFLVTAQADSLPHVRGDSITTQVRGTYLFSAPMAGSVVRWSADFYELDPWEVRISGVGREWTVGRQHSWWSPREATPHGGIQGIDTLDADGKVQLRIGTDSAQSGRGATARIEVAVTDVNRQVVTASTQALVHAASFYIALRDSVRSMWWPVKTPQRVQVIAVRPDGRRVAGVQVRLAVVRYRWSAPDTAGGDNWSRAWRADTMHVDTVVTADSALTFALPALREGPVEIVASATDEHGRRVVTTMGRYAYGSGGIAGGAPKRLPLRVQQARLAPGADAVVSFTSPWPSADAWVTVEREGVMSERVLRGVRGSVTFRLPMTEREIPNAFVSVLLVRRGRFGVVDAPADRLRVGHAALSVNDALKRLAVRVRALRADYAPGDSATIELTVHDAKGHGTAAEAIIWAVDEGVLSLTDFRTPDLMARLYAPVGDGVSLVSTLDYLRVGVPAWRRRMGGEVSLRSAAFSVAAAPAGGASYGVYTPRRDFLSTAFFRGGVQTDTNGVARVTVKLPDNITTFRLMAVAVTAHDQYGSAESPMLVTKPLLVRAAMPRFLRAADSVFAGGVINARDARARRIDVTASGTGVRLTGDSTLRATLATTGTDARFAWRGVAGDSAHVVLRVTDGRLSDAVALALPIKPDQSPRSRTIAGTVRGTATVRFLLPRNLDPAKSRLTIRSGTSPVPTLRVARGFLLASSYSCPDQLTSAGRMLVSLLALERVGTRVLGDTLWARGQLQHIADELTRRDRSGWVLCCWEDPWEGSPVRVAADLLLLDLRDIGIAVDTTMVRRISVAFTRMLDSVPLYPDTSYGRRQERGYDVASHLQGRLGAVVYLRRIGALRQRELEQLRDHASRLTWEDRAWLALALEQTGDHPGAQRLLDQLWSGLGVLGNRVDVPDSVLTSVGFPSHIRPVARLLEATMAIEPEHPRLGLLVERLTTRQRAERDEWWNTQDHVSATVALSRFALRERRAPGRGGPLRVRVGADADRTADLVVTTESAQDTSVSLDGLTRVKGDSLEVTVRLNAEGGAQYYAITIDEMTTERATAPAVRGLSVERWYERFDDGRTVTELREGDLVRVRLRVTVPSAREFVAVEDVLPAGLEPVDAMLRTSAALGPFADRSSESIARRREAEAGGTPRGELYGSWLGGWWSPWAAPEMHDERTVFFARKLWPGSFTLGYLARATTAGRFVRPQAHAEEVYNRGVNGRSEGGWFEVRPAEVKK